MVFYVLRNSEHSAPVVRAREQRTFLAPSTLSSTVAGAVDDDSSLDGRVVVESGARVVASTIRGPVVIGADTTIEHSLVGPFSAIGNRCVVQHSEIEHSVVMDDSSLIEIARLEDPQAERPDVVHRGDHARDTSPHGAC